MIYLIRLCVLKFFSKWKYFSAFTLLYSSSLRMKLYDLCRINTNWKQILQSEQRQRLLIEGEADPKQSVFITLFVQLDVKQNYIYHKVVVFKIISDFKIHIYMVFEIISIRRSTLFDLCLRNLWLQNIFDIISL